MKIGQIVGWEKHSKTTHAVYEADPGLVFYRRAADRRSGHRSASSTLADPFFFAQDLPPSEQQVGKKLQLEGEHVFCGRSRIEAVEEIPRQANNTRSAEK
jgi:hypothetical protein